MSLKDPNSRLTRWHIKLEEFNYNIVYNKDKQNANADALSRIKIEETHNQTTNDEEQVPENDLESILNDALKRNFDENMIDDNLENDFDEYLFNNIPEEPQLQLVETVIDEHPADENESQTVHSRDRSTHTIPSYIRNSSKQIPTTSVH